MRVRQNRAPHRVRRRAVRPSGPPYGRKRHQGGLPYRHQCGWRF